MFQIGERFERVSQIQRERRVIDIPTKIGNLLYTHSLIELMVHISQQVLALHGLDKKKKRKKKEIETIIIYINKT